MSNRGFFAIGIYHTKDAKNVGSLWRAALLFNAALVFTVGKRYERQASDTSRTSNHIPLIHFSDMDDLVSHLPHSCPLVGVEMSPMATPLHRYSHPPRAAYLLGAEDHGLPLAVQNRCHSLVTIESPMRWSMNVACAGSILMYDRFMKVNDG